MRPSGSITQYAAAKAGAILVNINPAYRLRELEYALNQSGVSASSSRHARFRKTDYVEMLLELAPELTQCGAGPLVAARLPVPASPDLSRRERGAGRHGWESFLEQR